MPMDLIIRGGTIVDAASGTEKIADVLIEGGRFAERCGGGVERQRFFKDMQEESA